MTRTATRITQIATVAVPATDQERSLAFYTDVLGFEKTRDAPFGSGQRWIEVAPKGSDTLVILYTPPGMEARIGGFSNILWDTDDIQATFEDLKAKGVEFTQEPAQQGWGWWAQFMDPDGNEFGLGQSGS